MYKHNFFFRTALSPDLHIEITMLVKSNDSRFNDVLKNICGIDPSKQGASDAGLYTLKMPLEFTGYDFIEQEECNYQIVAIQQYKENLKPKPNRFNTFLVTLTDDASNSSPKEVSRFDIQFRDIPDTQNAFIQELTEVLTPPNSPTRPDQLSVQQK